MTDQTRRRFVRIAAASAAVGLAGCSGGDDGGAETTESMDDGMTESDDGMGDSTETDEGMGEMTDAMEAVETFEVTVTNVSEPGTITTSGGEDVAVPLSPVAYAVHSPEVTAFSEDEPASDGLEALAEDGDPSTLGEALSMVDGVETVNAVAIADGAEEAGPLPPGESYSFEVNVSADHRLTVATMFVQSNDLFYAPSPEGMSLFDGEEPVSGDLTDELLLWDAGTEENQEPGAGADQAPRQSGPDTGTDEDGAVRPVADVDDGYDYPDVSDVIEVTVSPTMDG